MEKLLEKKQITLSQKRFEKKDSIQIIKEERNVGIYLLRIVSMFMVVTLHVLGHENILKNSIPFSLNHNLAWILEIACYGAVNLFAITSGYVCVNSKHKWSKIVELWLKVFFYSAGVTLLYYFFSPDSVSIKTLISSCFPIISKQYWYFSAYFCLFLFIPFLNTFIKSLSKKKYQLLLGVITFSFVGLGWFSRIFNIDVFNLGNGYSFLWLASLYLVGAYFKIYQLDFQKIEKEKHLLFYLIGILIAFVSSTAIQYIKNNLTGNIGNRDFLISYISPLIVFNSIQLFLFFSKLNLKKGKNLILKLSTLSFGVYLFSEQPLIRNHFIARKFISLAFEPWYIMLSKVILIVLTVYITCTIIEWLRNHLFQKLHVSTLCQKIIDTIKKITNFSK